MSSLVHLYYNPIERVLDDALNVRFHPSCTTDVWRTSPQRINSFRPRIDVKQSDDTNTVTATFELPGLKSEDISIELQQNRLTVSGASSASNDAEQDGYTVRERFHGKFSRTLQLPFGTKAEDVKSRLENGVLTVTFPKSTPEELPQRISIG